jgi:hypothetical protein
MNTTFTQLIASSKKPIDWYKHPSVGVNADRQAVSILRHHDGMMKIMSVQEAVEKGYIAVIPASGSFCEVTHYVVMKFNVTVIVRDKAEAEAEEAREKQAAEDYRELIKKREKEQKEIDHYNKYGKMPM